MLSKILSICLVGILCASSTHLVGESSEIKNDNFLQTRHKSHRLTDNEIIELTLTEAKRALNHGTLTSERYVKVLFERIEQLSPKITTDPTKLNAFLYYNKKNALRLARQADKKRKSGAHVRKLEGLPVVFKDFYDVAGMPSTFATPGIRNCIPSTNAAVVQSMLNEGAIILGKTNMAELGFMVHNANNDFAGVVRNPYNLAYTTGASSGGSASAAAARLSPVGFGNDFGGSIRWPASCCGLIGFRPTENRWNNAGDVGAAGTGTNEAESGSLSRSVEDVILLDSIIAKDRSKVHVKTSKLRIGVPRQYFYDGIDPQILAAINATILNLQNAGVTIVEQDMGNLPLLNQIVNAWVILGNYQLFVLPTGFQATLATWAADINNPFLPTTLAQLSSQIASPDAINSIALFNSLPSDPATIAALTNVRSQVIALVNQYMDNNQLDAFLIPVSPILTPLNPNPADATPYDAEVTSKAATVPLIGFPSINMPVGMDSNGLPIGADLVARVNDDRRLLYIAKDLRPQFANIPAPSLP